MSTIREIAKRAGVSTGTVSNVLTGTVPVSPRRRERVLAAIRASNYQPNHVARSLKLRRTRMLGMIISDITNPFFSQMVRGAEDAALKRNYLLLTFNTDDKVEREKQVLAVLRQRRVDGVLLVVAPSNHRQTHILDALSSGIPIVCLDRVPPKIRVDSVTVDNVGGARECVRHLLDIGHQRVAIFTGSLALQTARERLQGFKLALKDAGRTLDPSLVYEGDFRADSGYALASVMLAGPNRPTALFISNGLMALGALKALYDSGLRCPQDLAIATFDDLPLVEVLHPPLTAVAQPAYSIGYKGAEILIQRIETKGDHRSNVKIRFPTELKIRESTIGFKGPMHQ